MSASSEPPRLSLALQGGGAHGAYGWGVLDRLLEEDLPIVAVSGASAGALNGAALVTGLVAGGRQGARQALERLWDTVSRTSPLQAFDLGMWAPPLFEPVLRRSLEVGKLVGRYVAPLSPGLRNMRALRRVVEESIDLSLLSDPRAIPLSIAATRVATGAARLFDNDAITLDALMASACLPDLFGPVTIDDEPYWDGGFSANPALEPLIFGGHGQSDLLIVQITPFATQDTPETLVEVMGRMSDIGFNACLLRDLKALTQVQAIARRAPPIDDNFTALANTNLHLMEASPALATRGPTGKIDTRRSQLEALRELGRDTADAWLRDHGGKLGQRSTLTALPEGVAA
ncbi:patatin [Sphingomonas sp. Leaf23]|uniref:patatin-like phospholipase family protein n=1 Tax=Sphingomonas sp. Leaf23 TaxID=1735689 RepID=UPI0006F88F15|nr:patatin-like phospholipase family protein [Sphingomonas sp. Leaf23]KQM87163.1 patatin [Sphingomonas sp. Leaf23]